MKDISKIDKKLTKIQNLVALSILEQEAVSLSVRDAVTGLERFKNGIVVDSFKDHSKGDVGQDQYRNSIDPKNNQLRAPFVQDQINLEEQYQTDESRLEVGNYKNNASIITCDYTQSEFITQPSATRFINCQPYSVFTYEGKLTLNPSVDTFQDITTLPDLVIEDNSVWDAMQNLSELLEASGLGTVWGDWETTSSTREGINTGGRTAPDNTDGSGGRSRSLPPGSTLITTEQNRSGLTLDFNPETASVNETSYGERVVDVQLARTMRTIPVFFEAVKLKPNTRYYAFFDGIDVSDYVAADTVDTLFSDGIDRYNGSPFSRPGGFGLPLTSDPVGNISGVFLIPNGRPPVQGTFFNGKLEDVEYQTSGPTRSFATGQRLFVLTSNPRNPSDLSQVEGIAKKEFTASGVLLDKQDTIVSTRIPETITISEDRTIFDIIPPPPPPPRPRDPIAQTFEVDQNFTSGVFISELDIFFRTKDEIQGVEAYIVSTDSQYPTQTILPHSRVVKQANSIIRIVCDLQSLSSVNLQAGVVIEGQDSGATATIKTDVLFQDAASNSGSNVSNRVYNVVLSNYMGEFTPGETIVPQTTPPIDALFTIAKNEVIPSRVDIKNLGKDYTLENTTVEFSAPELPGGRTATGSVKVGKGMVYEVTITDPGTGYIEAPSAQIVGDGTGAQLSVRIRDGVKSVEMGVATSDDATMPTTFRFESPVYLLGNTTYGIVVKSPNSLDYTVWISKLGENQIGTDRRVVTQPNLGSLFLSQNSGLWTEDQTMDLMFTLRRCEFSTNNTAELPLINSPITKRKIYNDPIEVSSGPAFGELDYESTAFSVNPKIVKVTHQNHGLVPNDLVVLDRVTGNPGGIPDELFNTIHDVVDVTLDTFTIMVDFDESVITPISVKSGGNEVMSSYNRPYETINLYSGVMSFPETNIVVRNRASEYAGVTGYNVGKQYEPGTLVEIPIMDTFYYNGAKQVANTVNEAKI